MIVLTNWTLQPRNLTNFEITHDILDINKNRETGSIITTLQRPLNTKTVLIMLLTGVKLIALFVTQERIIQPSVLLFHLVSVP